MALAIKLRYPDNEVPEVLADCIESITALRPPRLVETLRPYLEGRDGFLAATAATALAQSLGKEALPILAESFTLLSRDARVPLVLALTSIRSDETGRALLGFFEDSDPAVRQAAVEGASLYPDVIVRERIRTIAVDDPDPSVRGAAAEAMQRWR